MSKETRQPFIPTGDYIARRGFRFMGRSFAPGDEFPWRQLACSKRKLRQLYEGRFIDLKPAPGEDPPSEDLTETVETAEDTSSTEEVKTDQEGADAEETPEDSKDSEKKKEKKKETPPPVFSFNPKSHKVKSAGSGKYNITTLRGKVRLSVSKKEAQRLKKVKKPTEVRPEEIVE